MASLLGLGGKNNQRPIEYSGLNVGSSKMDMPIVIFWGMRRLTTNAIWYNDFQKHKMSKGGKGGGKGGEQYDYTVAVITALCEGPIDLIQNIWGQISTTSTTTLVALNQTLFLGTSSQLPWSFVTGKYPAQARSYPYTTYLACPKMDLGSTATIPDNQYECQRVLSFSYTVTSPGYIHPDTHVQDDGIDVLISDAITDLLTNPQYGDFFSSADIGPITQYAAYTRAQGLFYSPVVDSQDKLTSVLNRWAQISNAWIYWSGTQLQFYPLADTAITGNGVTFTPDNDIAYALTPADVIGDVPFKVQRKRGEDCFNRTRLDITDRTLGYVSNPLEYKDQTLVDQFGLRDNSGIDGRDICNPVVGKIVVQLIGKRAAYIRNTYSFKTNYRFIRCLPGTVLSITDPNIGLDQVRVRVRSIKEAKDNTLDFVAEEFPGTVATYGHFDPTVGSQATFPNAYSDPGSINTPAIVEPDSAFTGGVARLLIAASGGAEWGGCQVWISFDDVSYILIGSIDAAAGQGVLTAPLPSHTGLDTVNTLSVDCTESLTELPAVSNADADALRTLAMVAAQPTLVSGVYVMPNDGELLAWGDTATVTTYDADLTYLPRGQYGTSPASHSAGDQFTPIDVLGQTGTTLAYDLPKDYIGQPIYLKMLSFNNFGNSLEDISMVNVYKYTPTGRGYGGGTGGVPIAPTGTGGAGGINQAHLYWDANPASDNVTGYEIWYALGTSVGFGSCSKLMTVASLGYTAASLLANQAYTFYIVAVNQVGSSLPSSVINVTTSTIDVLAPIYVPSTFVPSTMTANVVLLLHKFGEPSRARANLAGWQFGATANATGSTVITVQRALAATPNTWVTIGTITIGAGTITPTFASVGGLAYDFAISDELRIIGPASPDATLADPHITALMDRTG